MGAVLAAGSIGASEIGCAAILMVASCCLVAHAFLLNDWAGIDGDLNSASRADQTFAAKGVGRETVGVLATVSLMAGLALSGLLGLAPLLIALGIAGASALYSSPLTHMKGTPIAGTVLHLAGGALHFLLGYSVFARIDGAGVATSAFFGLAFAAGHLMHEVRDYEGDLVNGIRTNAVAFSKRGAFIMVSRCSARPMRCWWRSPCWACFQSSSCWAARRSRSIWPRPSGRFATA